MLWNSPTRLIYLWHIYLKFLSSDSLVTLCFPVWFNCFPFDNYRCIHCQLWHIDPKSQKAVCNEKIFCKICFPPFKICIRAFEFYCHSCIDYLSHQASPVYKKTVWILLLVVVQKKLQKVGNTMFGESFNSLKLPNESGKPM